MIPVLNVTKRPAQQPVTTVVPAEGAKPGATGPTISSTGDQLKLQQAKASPEDLSASEGRLAVAGAAMGGLGGLAFGIGAFCCGAGLPAALAIVALGAGIGALGGRFSNASFDVLGTRMSVW